MSRATVYFRAPTRSGGVRVVTVVEHGPYHEHRPASWRGPYATSYDAERGYQTVTESEALAWLRSLGRADVRLPRALGVAVEMSTRNGQPWTIEALITGGFAVAPGLEPPAVGSGAPLAAGAGGRAPGEPGGTP